MEKGKDGRGAPDMSKIMERKGGTVLPRLSPERWQELETFPLRQGDVFIATYPKSGTTWMQQIVKLLRNGGKRDDIKLDKSIPWLEVLDSDFGKMLGYTPDMATSSDVISPRAFKSHSPYEHVPGGLPHTTAAKYIYVMRNPKDVCVSIYYHRLMMTEVVWEELLSEFSSANIVYGNWCDHVLGWWKNRDAPNILFVKYEDMKTDPTAAVRTVADFIGIKDTTDELIQSVVENSSFSNMKKNPNANYAWFSGHDKVFSREGQFMRKGEVGDWKQHFTDAESENLDEFVSEKLRGSCLTVQYD